MNHGNYTALNGDDIDMKKVGSSSNNFSDIVVMPFHVVSGENGAIGHATAEKGIPIPTQYDPKRLSHLDGMKIVEEEHNAVKLAKISDKSASNQINYTAYYGGYSDEPEKPVMDLIESGKTPNLSEGDVSSSLPNYESTGYVISDYSSNYDGKSEETGTPGYDIAEYKSSYYGDH
mmetsp:Transcript_27406/g.27641  ORF Transcript_27406/g.27641 Transcript_27406/m.27641 type:complete len:175 (+) Transcript_27406:79-603(+)|eukprot:CAMPEP_0182420492 /NCGR_PEP_ID=MMETSP1167-20130531/5335_1 /TAXON_ID=2988 /ORGANISM="Mallomonas Sp, Strain CCMP3275" /LENGTH=174 /DNA_ID=CAMNT_0024596507 /DNA_START=48 /DNA_END=572 /DNA_ORIENTATION=-